MKIRVNVYGVQCPGPRRCQEPGFFFPGGTHECSKVRQKVEMLMPRMTLGGGGGAVESSCISFIHQIAPQKLQEDPDPISTEETRAKTRL